MNSLIIETPEASSHDLPKILTELDQACLDYSWNGSTWIDYLKKEAQAKVFLAKKPFGPGQEIKQIGFILFQLNPWSKQAHLLKIGILENERGGTASSEMFISAKNWLQEREYEEIYLEVSALNGRAQGFYRKLGFEELCVKKQFYSDGADALAMLLSL